MATSTRQTNLFVSEDWKKVYQTFKSADFESYDFETLRSTMISYLRKQFPCLLYTSPSPRDGLLSRMPSSA